MANPILSGLQAAAKAAKAAKAAAPLVDKPVLKIRPPSDNVANVRDANFRYPKTIGNQTVKIDKINGGVRFDKNESKRVDQLAAKISSPDGYFSRIIVDQDNNVIEGQHRLEALRKLGIEDVPVYKIEDLGDTMPVNKMQAAMESVGAIHSDHVNQLMNHALQHIAEDGLDSARKMNYGAFQKFYDAALDAAAPIAAPQDEALRLAQQRAALPVKQGGLGLPADNTPAQRATAMGFETDVYHGTTNDFNKFAGRHPTYAAEEPRIADIYANATTRHMSLNRPINAGPNIMPLKLGGKEFSVSDLGEGGGGWYSDNLAEALGIPRARGAVNELPNYGIDRLKVTDMGDLGGVQTQHMIPSGSDNIRSRFAVFDPFRRNAATAAALGVAAPDLLAKEKAKGGEVSQDAMRMALSANKVQHKGVGGIAKLVANSAKAVVPKLPKGQQAVLSAAESAANLERFLEQSKTQQRLYHGTTASEGGKGEEAIRRLKPSKEGALGSGVYLTPDPKFAGEYSFPKDISDVDRASIQSSIDNGEIFRRGRGTILPVFSQMKNPLILEGIKPPGAMYSGDPMVEALKKLGMDEDKASNMVEKAYENRGYIGKQVQNRAQAQGYDGIMQYRDGELMEVLPFSSNQVKSAIGNEGTYDITNPNLSKAKGGEVSQDAMRMALWKHPVKREAGGEAEPTPEEMKASRLISQKRRGAPIDTSGAEALGTMLSGLGAAIPAGYAGLVELARTRDPKMAAEATEDLQRRYMALPTDQKTGDKVEGMAKFLEPLSKPAQYMGEKALGLFGPEVATATEVFLDPLNALPLIGKVPAAAKAVGRTLGPTADKMVMELMQKQGLAPGVVPKGLGGLSRQEFAMDTLYPGRDFESLVSAEKSAVKRYAGALETPAVVRRETTSGPTIATPNVVMSSPKIVTPEYFKEGRPMVPFVGDTSGGGYDLSQIAGIPLSQNVPVQAGFMYPFIQKAAKRQGVFASMKGMADKKLDNLLEAAEKTGENPYGSFSAMGPESINFSTPVAESIITQLPYLQLSKKALNEFNRAIKLPSAGYLAQPNFLGVGHPDIISQLRGVNGFPIKGAGELRKKIIDLASSAKFRNMGFPHYEDIADAIIHPDLVGAPRGLTGSAIFETNPSKGLITDPKEVAHFSYDSGYHGSRPVQLKHNVPSKVWYKNIYEKGMKEGFPQVAIDPKTGRTKDQRPLTADEVTGALMMRKDLFQPTNAEWLDHVMGYLRKTHPNAGYKKGGVIKAAEGGEITSDDLIVDERPL